MDLEYNTAEESQTPGPPGARQIMSLGEEGRTKRGVGVAGGQ